MILSSKKFLTILIFYTAATAHATNNVSDWCTVPEGLKNFPLSLTSDGKVVYKFEGVCGQISQFQVLCAGAKAIQGAIKDRVELVGNNAQASVLAAGIQEYLMGNSTGKKTLDLAKIIAGAFFVPMEGVRKVSESLMLKKDDDTYRPAVRYVDANAFDNNNTARWARLKDSCAASDDARNNDALPPLLAMDISRQQRLTTAHTYEETKTINGQKKIPYTLSVVDDTQHPQKITYYELTGVSQMHNYGLQTTLPITAKTFYQHFFRYSLMPSAILMRSINIPWGCHVDAYVRYGDSWYVLDDETRWKASAVETDCQQLKVRTPAGREIIGKLLTSSYPGAPISLLYNEIDKADYERLRQSPQQETIGQRLHLERDIPISLSRKLQLMTALAAGAVGDAAMVGITTAVLASIFGSQNPDVAGVIMGAATGTASIGYHAQHIFPMLSTSKTYTPHAAGLGPREPMM